MTHRRPLLALVTLLNFACSPSDDAGPLPSGFTEPTGGTATSGGQPGDGAGGSAAGANTAGTAGISGENGLGGGPPAPPARARCAAPAGLTGAPDTIEKVVQWLNALPKPTTAACFLESLPRPLAMVVTSSQFSAQPAISPKSPRVFLELGRLWVSAVVDGEPSYLLEFGERPPDSELSSLKGELQLPLDAAITSNAPYERVRFGSGTTCGFCHRSEQVVPELSPDAFVSSTIRPRWETYVSVAALRAEHESCDFTANAHRCEMLSALFDGGEVHETTFPEEMPTFF